MAEIFWHTAADALIDSLKLFPFLLATYLALEYLEEKAGDKTVNLIRRPGRSSDRRVVRIISSMRAGGGGFQLLCRAGDFRRHFDCGLSFHFRRNAADFDFQCRTGAVDCKDIADQGCGRPFLRFGSGFFRLPFVAFAAAER